MDKQLLAEKNAAAADLWVEFHEHLLDLLIAWTPKLVVCGLIFLTFYALAIIAYYLIGKMYRKASATKQPVFLFVGYIAKIGIILIGAVTALGSAGVNISALVASLGLSGFALSFAMKDTLSNMVAGIMLLIYHPFSIGDTIEVGSQSGEIVAINLRYVRLHCQGHDYLIPNAKMLVETVKLVKVVPDSEQT